MDISPKVSKLECLEYSKAVIPRQYSLDQPSVQSRPLYNQYRRLSVVGLRLSTDEIARFVQDSSLCGLIS